MTSTKNNSKKLVAILMGSASDWDVMSTSQSTLNDFEIPNEARVLSAHRTPQAVSDYIRDCEAEGVEVFIAAAGMAAHLAGAVAAQTCKPVIGVPLSGSSLGGFDALLSTVQMPGGIPVATVAIGKAGAKNAAILAAQILGVKYPELAEKVKKMRLGDAEKVLKTQLS